MEKKELYVAGLSGSVSQDGKNYALILQEVKGERKIPILIGSAEGQAIALVMEKLKPRRPITHDLFKDTIIGLGGSLKEVLIYGVEGGIFFSKLILLNARNEEIEMDARPSDAIALAVRFNCPIYSYEYVINEAAVVENMGRLNLKKGSFAEYTIEELEELLANILAKEDYESASRIRDVLDRRKGLQDR